MQYLRRVRHWLRRNTSTITNPDSNDYKTTMQLVRKAYFAENYDEALDILAQALETEKIELDATTRIDVTLTRSDILIAKGDYKNAEIILKDLQIDSEGKQHLTPLAYSLSSLGMIAQRQGNVELARERYEEARVVTEKIKADGASGRATAHLADTYLHEGNASYALYLLKDAIPKLRNSGDKELLGYFLSLLGEAEIASGYAEDGLETMRRGYEVAATMQHIAQMRLITEKLGRAYAEQGNFRRARHYLKEAIQLYRHDAESSDAYIDLVITLSNICLQMGDDPSAKQYAKQAHQLATTQHNEEAIQIATALIALAQRKTQNPDEILVELRNSAAAFADNHLVEHPIYLALVKHIAELQAQLGMLAEARENYEKVMASDNKLEIGYARAGIADVISKTGDLREAIAAHKQASDYFAGEGRHGMAASQHCAIGVLYSRIGDGRMALRSYGDALMLINRIDEETIRGAILAYVANAYSDYGDIDSAIDFFEQTIEIAKSSSQRYAEATRRGNYGRLLALIGKRQRALDEIQYAKNYFSGQEKQLEVAIQHNNLGIAHRASGDLEQAIANQQTALEAVQHIDAGIWHNIIQVDLADTCRLMGNIEQASHLYDIAKSDAEAAAYANVVIQAAIGQIQSLLMQGRIDDAVNPIENLESPLKRAYLRRYLAQWYEARSQVHQARGDVRAAQSTWEEAQSLRQAMHMPQLEPTWLTL